MSTRGLWGYIHNEYEFLTYNHFDSYPEGLGLITLSHARKAEADINPLHRVFAVFDGDGSAFAADSLFCEYGYVIDLDRRVFEVYEGFQTAPHDQGRFTRSDVPEPSYRGGPRYYPIKLAVSWPLDELPSDEEFIKFFEDREEES